jgi:membrane protease YdiL (CAAX protease family)
MYTPYVRPVPAEESKPPPFVAGRPAAKNPIPRTVVLAILMGVVLQVVAYALIRGLHLAPATGVMLGLGLTVAFYLVVLSLVQGRLIDSDVRPAWHLGAPGTGVAVGVTVGACMALGIAGLLTLLAGHVSSDANAMTAIAQGGVLRVGMLVLVTVIAAPFVEELLFRGLLAESMRGKGRGAAIWLSALAFALWHLRLGAIWYYLLMGALFGVLYWKRGLVCSMSAHATFNGLLTVIAALAITGAPHTVTAAGVSVSAPAAWSVHGTSDAGIQLQSASGAEVEVGRIDAPRQVDATALTSAVNKAPALGEGVVVQAGTVQAVRYPAGTGAEAAVDVRGHSGYVVMLSTPRAVIIAVLVTGGNANARPQFESMLHSLQVSS